MVNRRILVTGSSGFIGQHLVHRLQKIGFDLIEWDKDIKQIQTFNTSVDSVIHLAGITQFNNQSNILKGYEINVGGTLAVLNYCRQKGASCIFASTSAVYGDYKSLRVVKESDTINPISHYGISKSLAEMACKNFVEDYDMSCQILRLFNVYGQGQKKPFLIPDIIDSMTNEEKLIIRTPNVVRDFIHVSDVVDVFIRCLQTNLEQLQLLNVGTGFGTQISEIVAIIKSYSSNSLSIEKTEELDHGPACGIIADTQHTRAILNWVNTTSIRAGLESLVKGY